MSSIPPIKNLLFDLDNTLINRDLAFKKLIHYFFSFHHIPFTHKEINIILEKDQQGFTKRMEFAKWFIQKYPPPHLSPETFYAWQIANIAKFIPPVSEGIKAMLEKLSKQHRIILLTNGGIKNQLAKLKQAELAPYFPKERRFISQEIGYAKPNRLAFQTVLTRIKLQGKKTLMIGDNPLNDIQGAKNAGIQTCWVSSSKTFPENIPSPDFIIQKDTLAKDLLNLLTIKPVQ